MKSSLKSGNACYQSVQNLLSSNLLPKHLKNKICRTIILPAVLYGCETWSLTLREERTPRGIFLEQGAEENKRKANWIGHILRRNCLLKQVIKGKIKGEMKVARRRGRRRKKLLDDLKDRRGYSHLKEEALDRTMWRHRFGGGFGPVVRQITG